MKPRLRSLVGLVGLGAALVVPAAGQAAPDLGYTMYCRGGQGLTDVLAEDRVLVFKKHILHGSDAYGTGPLAPGTCTWADRGIRADEPRQLMFVGRHMGAFHVSTSGGFELGQVARVDGQYRELEGGRTYTWLNQLRDPNWVVEVTAKRSTIEWAEPGAKVKTLGVFRITSFRRATQVASNSNRG